MVFNSDEKPEAEKRILDRIRTLSCDGVVLVPVGDSTQHLQRDPDGKSIPTVLFGRTVEDDKSDTVTIDNISAGRQATEYLLDLGHTPHRHDHRAAAPDHRTRPARRHAGRR